MENSCKQQSGCWFRTVCVVALLLGLLLRDAAAADNQTLDDCGQPVASPPAGCSGCHGAPPDTAVHPQDGRCVRCHGQVVDAEYGFVQETLHNNGAVDAAVGCSSCHGWDRGVSPPQDLSGACSPGGTGTGAHQAMRRDAIPVHRINCSDCHVVPLAAGSAGHIDGDGRAEVVFSGLATAGDAEPVWNGTTCAGVYCHGATLTGGTLTEPGWQNTSGAAGQCGACHRLTDPSGNTDADCSGCHSTSVSSAGTILPLGTHLNGVVDLDNATGTED